MKTIINLLLLSFVLVHSGIAQTTDTLKVTRVSCTSEFDAALKPETLIFTPLADTLLIERRIWQGLSSKPIAIKKVINDTIGISFADTGRFFLTMDCYQTYLIKLPGVFSSKTEVVLNIKNKFYTVSNLTTGIHNDQKTEEVLLFPNPTKNHVFINKNNYSNIIVRNALGLEVLQTSASATSIDLGAFEAGIYYLTFLSKKGSLTKMVYKQ